MKTIQPGQLVTCKVAVEASYSDYGPNKGTKILFSPGVCGIVTAILPKVHKLKRGVKLPGHDNKDEFLSVTFRDFRGQAQRTGLDFCNVKVLRITDVAHDVYVPLQLQYIQETITATAYRKACDDVVKNPNDNWLAVMTQTISKQWNEAWENAHADV